MSWLRALHQWLLLRLLTRAVDDAARHLASQAPPRPPLVPDNVVHLPRRRTR
jgi:hypothetical protein